MDHRNELIQQHAQGRTFVDVGGLWGEVNEKGSIAMEAGASSLTMLDIWPPESEWWLRLRSRFEAKKLAPPREVIGSIDNSATIQAVGLHDVVHCSGVLYHCPNPVLTLRNLLGLTGETLIIASAVIPRNIRNQNGEMFVSDDSPIFVPGLDDDHRRVLSTHITERYGGGALGIDQPTSDWFFSDGAPNYGPWWWLWTATGFLRLLRAVGFDVIDERSQFDGTGHLAVCKPRVVSTENYSIF